MNLGLGNLKELKTQLLAEVLRDDPAYDPALIALGKGIAAQFENYCNRKFERAADAQDVLPADQCQFLLSRFPVETVDLVELKLEEATGWEEQESTFIRTIDQKSGIVYTPDAADAGPYWAQVRFTYTGGYWFDTSEDGSGVMPETATALPDDLKLAWFLQCRQAWSTLDKLGKDILTTGSSSQFVTGTLSSLDLVPDVKRTLGDYRRLQLT